MTNTPQLGVTATTALVVASMVGAGVFTTSGFALADLGSANRVMLAWLYGGVVAVLGAVSYSLIVRQVIESGGEYVFLARNVHPMAGFVAGWVSMLAGFTGAIAFAASAFEAYLLPSTAPGWLPDKAVAIGLVAIAGILHGNTPVWGLRTQTCAVAIKLGAILLFVALATVLLIASDAPVPIYFDQSPVPFSFALLASTMVWIFLSYSGFNAAVYVVEEVQHPQRVVPQAMLAGTLLVSFVYLSLNAIFVYGAPYEVVAGAPNVAYVVAQHIGGYWFSETIRLIVLLGLFTSVLSLVMAGPRVYAKMADDGLLPASLGTAEGMARAVWLQAMLAIVILLIAGLRELLAYLGLTLSLSSALAIASVARVYLQSDDPHRPLWHWIVPAFYVLTILGLALTAARHNPAEFVAALLTIASGCIGYFIARRQRCVDS